MAKKSFGTSFRALATADGATARASQESVSGHSDDGGRSLQPSSSSGILQRRAEPQQLSAQLVYDLYRRRWQIEDAFLLTKRLLGSAYLWVGGRNGVQIQLYAPWIF